MQPVQEAGFRVQKQERQMIYDAPFGLDINAAIRNALRLAKKRKDIVRLKFNGRIYTVKPTSTEDSVYFQFERMTGLFKSKFGKPYPRPA